MENPRQPLTKKKKKKVVLEADGDISKELGNVGISSKFTECFMMKGAGGVKFWGSLGGLATMISGITGAMNIFNWSQLAVELELVFFGLLIVILELETTCCPNSGQKFLEENMKGFTRLWGRAFLYFVVATMLFVQYEWMEAFIGSYLVFMGLTYLLVAKFTADKMHELKTNLGVNEVDTTRLHAQFDALDKDHSGTITESELYELGKRLGLNFNTQEMSLLMSILDKNGDGDVSYKEFHQWFTSKVYYCV